MEGKEQNILDNKGLTLVELIVSMAILSIVILLVSSFLSVGSKSYNNASDEVQLQMASQTVMNQLEDMIVESYWVTLKNKSTNEEALIIYSQSGINIVIYNNNVRKLYLVEKSPTEVINLSAITYTDEMNLMSNDVYDISLSDEVQMQAKKEVQLAIDFKVNKKILKEKRTIYFRNQMVKPTDVP